MPIMQALDWVGRLKGEGNKSILTERESIIAQQILKEIIARLNFLKDCGTGISGH